MKRYSCLLCLLLFGCCNENNKPLISRFNWVVGTWENSSGEQKVYEAWAQKSEHELVGVCYMLVGGDTTVLETIRVVQQNDTLFYIPTVQDQNNGLPIRFALTNCTANELVFENPNHDFPKLISYTRIAPDSLAAKISDGASPNERAINFPMKKIK